MDLFTCSLLNEAASNSRLYSAGVDDCKQWNDKDTEAAE
jgi:hypothetical protein